MFGSIPPATSQWKGARVAAFQLRETSQTYHYRVDVDLVVLDEDANKGGGFWIIASEHQGCVIPASVRHVVQIKGRMEHHELVKIVNVAVEANEPQVFENRRLGQCRLVTRPFRILYWGNICH